MKNVAFDITGRCNLKCEHCGTEEPIEGNIRKAPDPSLEDCKQAFMNFKKMGIEYLHFLGGEPTLRKDLPLLIAQAKHLGLTVGMTTNGILLTEDSLYQYCKNGLTHIVLSIDAPTAEKNDFLRGKGSFKAALNCVKLINRYRKDNKGEIFFSVRSALTSLWIDSTVQMIELCQRLEVDELIIKKVRKVGRAKKNWDILDFDNELLFQACEEIAVKVAEVDFLVVFPFKALVNHYFNKAHGLQNTRLPSPCEGGDSTFQCFSDGTLVPCAAFAQHNSFPLSMAPAAFSPLVPEDVENNEYFRIFKTNIRENHKLLEKFEPCNQCPFAGHICSPCPLEVLDKEKVIVPLCAMALEKLNLNWNNWEAKSIRPEEPEKIQ